MKNNELNKNNLDVLYTICTPEYCESQPMVASDLIRLLIRGLQDKNEYLRRIEAEVNMYREIELMKEALKEAD